MNFSDYRAIEFRRDGKVLHATFNRPGDAQRRRPGLHHDWNRLFDDVAAEPTRMCW